MELFLYVNIVYLLAIHWLLKSSRSSPVPHAISKESRYIINNRKNAFFNKPLTEANNKMIPSEFKRINGSKAFIGIPKKLKDLTVEESAYQNYYSKFHTNFLQSQTWTKVDHHLRTSNYFTNASYARDGFEPDEKGREPEELSTLEIPKVNEISDNVKGDSEEMIWKSKKNKNDFSASRTIEKESNKPEMITFESEHPQTSTNVTPFSSWKYKGRNLIDDELEERHVYETRIETVSYHHEIISNQPGTKCNMSNYEHGRKNYIGLENHNKDAGKTFEEEINKKESNIESGKKNKFGYIVEGKNYRKYRVEERTGDGFIVGEYGVFSHDDGSLRGVRYTADSTINPQLIYEALMKFLSL